MKFDLVIQGPLDKTSLDRVDVISDQFENIVISHWSEDDSSLLKNIQSKNVNVYHQPIPDRNKTVGVMKDSTFFYSIASTYMGIQKCQSNYTIKMRSDEIYTDLQPLKEKFLQNDKKFVFGNIFAKPWSHSRYHIGDHLFVSTTKNLLNLYRFLYNIYTRNGNLLENSWAVQGYPSHQTAESILACSFLKCKEIPVKDWNNFSTFENHFDVIDINLLGKYVACWKHGYQTYSSHNNPFDWNIKTIKDMK